MPDIKEKEPSGEFTFFPKLPTELQIIVWKHAIPPPRLVRVLVQVIMGMVLFSTNMPVPALLHTCTVARETILRVYTTCLESEGGKKIRLDGNHDVLVLFSSDDSFKKAPFSYEPLPWIPQWQPMYPEHIAMFAKVKLLATLNYIYTNDFPENLEYVLSQFKSLERFVPLECCRLQNLDIGENEVYLTIPEGELARLGIENSQQWKASKQGTEHLKKMREQILNEMKGIASKIDIVPAYVEGASLP
ncbi:hypothetical protein L207DRAFT_589606 [Hyaloscypha variabilis F]|jgi:hypothetical protein|uniref:2EXR domain-containing protein n=1 Tax=Hyaloscypha variabilis (strain UAMH 11265 / GT02V1 / F) TaxID=1149755 RepID=A0A2J6R3Y9_HYAVF|nr:hypothetical protein L207DRAFT_589606 [Hyaloscypha variabilis F]